MLYHYVQREEDEQGRGKWSPVPAKSLPELISSNQARRYSVLAVNQIVEEDTAKDELQYLGPLYFDIDLKNNLNLAISSAQELVKKLKELDVPDEGIKVYASGSKGFHVFVPESLFMTSLRPVRGLPHIYMEVARDLYVMGIDFAVYSGGKGRMFRPENGLRPDGRYRVRITLEELDRMTPELYTQLVSAPRDLQLKGPNGHKSAHLTALYERAKKRARERPVMRGVALPTEQLKPYAEEPPACVDKLVAYDVQKGGNFNTAGLQLAIFLARAGTPAYKADSLVAQMAERGESQTYDTEVKRQTHLKGLISYAGAKPGLAFTCNAMRSVVGNKMCRDCPVEQEIKEGQDSTVDEDGAILGVLAEHDGYYLKREKGDVRVSTFTLSPTEIVIDQPQGAGIPRRMSTNMEVYTNGNLVGEVTFDESGWRSKAEFLKQVEGVPNIAFLGTDADVQRIKYAVYRHSGDDDVDEVINVHSAGIHVSTLGKKRIYTYVEPGLSINTYNVQGTHRLQGSLTAAPELRMSAKPQAGDQNLRAVLRNLLSCNQHSVIAPILGWHCAAHLKQHITAIHKQFPVLSVWGEAGSGKSHTEMLFCHLNGVNYWSGGSPLSCSTTTPFPVVETCASTTTVPRILEEFNKSQMRDWMYKWITDVVKAAWDGIAVPRGALSRSRADGQSRSGARVESYYITAPIILISEQAPDKPALKQRSVQVQLTRGGRAGCTEAYQMTVKNRPALLSLSRALTFMALRTQEAWVDGRLAANTERLGDALFDRHLFTYAVLLTGLDFFEAVTASLNLDLEPEVEQLRQAMLMSVEAAAPELDAARLWTEVDIFLSSVAEMAQLALQNHPASQLIPGKHFTVPTGSEELLIDMTMVFGAYKRHARNLGETAVFSTLRTLEPLLKSETYFKGMRTVPQIAGTRPLWVLSLTEMEKKGHDTSLWVSAI